MTLPRSDCALCFAGDTADTYPLMVQMAYAIAAHEPSRERSMDIARVKAHLLRLFTDLVRSLKTPAVPFKSDDAQFLFAGYSWLKKDFRIWTIQYLEREKRFISRRLSRTNAAHNKLQRFERTLRRFIDKHMTRAFGPNWPKQPLWRPKLDR